MGKLFKVEMLNRTLSITLLRISCDTVNPEKIALVKFLRFYRLASDSKLKFAMISAATLSVYMALHVAVNLQT